MHSRAASPALRRYAKLVATCTWILLLAGGMVTSTGSGLSVPDWPLSFGQVMPEMEGGVLYEHGHRMIASFVGFLIVVLAIALQRSAVPRRLRVLGWLAVGLVILQGVLGGLTVLLRLPDPVSIAHAGLAELVFGLMVVIALVTSSGWARMQTLEPRVDRRMIPLVRLAAGVAVLIWLQILLGAWVRHAGAGLAIPTFPLAYGHIVPPLESKPVIIHYAHRVGGVVVALAVSWAAVRTWRDHGDEGWLARPAALLAALVPVQIALGGWIVLAHKHPWVATFHLGTGALLFATAIVLAARARCRLRLAPAAAAPPIEPIPVAASR
jgi:cytochrome c oxidase assembly protein subunit 15